MGHPDEVEVIGAERMLPDASFPLTTHDAGTARVFPVAFTEPAVFCAAKGAVRRSAPRAGDDSDTAGRTRSFLRTAAHHRLAALVTVSAGASDAAHKSSRRAGARFGRAVRPFWLPDSAWAARSVFLRHP